MREMPWAPRIATKSARGRLEWPTVKITALRLRQHRHRHRPRSAVRAQRRAALGDPDVALRVVLPDFSRDLLRDVLRVAVRDAEAARRADALAGRLEEQPRHPAPGRRVAPRASCRFRLSLA